jgi:stage III sporulation protein AH
LKKSKRNIILAAVLLLVCAAVYLNWSFNDRWGKADNAMVEAEDENMAEAAGESQGDADQATEVSEYFSEARLTRQTSRDQALSLLQTAAGNESASQETIDAAMDAIAAMPTGACRRPRWKIC